jgi:hypothetical protein
LREVVWGEIVLGKREVLGEGQVLWEIVLVKGIALGSRRGIALVKVKWTVLVRSIALVKRRGTLVKGRSALIKGRSALVKWRSVLVKGTVGYARVT